MGTETTLPVEQDPPPAHLANTPAAPRLSTYWMPLEGLIQEWTAFGANAEDAPALTAAAHALFGLAHEKQALRHFTFATEQQRSRYPKDTSYWYGQAHHALFLASHHWGCAARALENGTPADCSPLAPDEVRHMLHMVRTQQQRLWQLCDEVRRADHAWLLEHEQGRLREENMP